MVGLYYSKWIALALQGDIRRVAGLYISLGDATHVNGWELRDLGINPKI